MKIDDKNYQLTHYLQQSKCHHLFFTSQFLFIKKKQDGLRHQILYYLQLQTQRMRQRANHSSLNLSHQLKQLDKDKIAIQNTRKVIQDRQEMKRQYQRWIPQSINNQNALFSQVPQKHKPMKKQSRVATISINIFDLPSDFKPCVKRTDLSTRNSNLFSQNQSKQNWKSTSKRVGEVNNCRSREISPKKHVKIAQLHNGKKTTIDLSWGAESRNLNRQKINSRMYKSYYNKLNSSSMKL